MRMKWLIAGAILAIHTSPAQASDQGPGQIFYVHAMQGGVVLFSLSGPRNTQPSCGPLNRWSFDASSSDGQAVLSILLTAYATGKPVIVKGSNICPDGYETERVDYLYTNDPPT